MSITSLAPERPPRVDFPQILRELSAAQVPMIDIATYCERDVSTVLRWKNRGHRPAHEDGEALIALHRQFCAKP